MIGFSSFNSPHFTDGYNLFKQVFSGTYQL